MAWGKKKCLQASTGKLLASRGHSLSPENNKLFLGVESAFESLKDELMLKAGGEDSLSGKISLLS